MEGREEKEGWKGGERRGGRGEEGGDISYPTFRSKVSPLVVTDSVSLGIIFNKCLS